MQVRQLFQRKEVQISILLMFTFFLLIDTFNHGQTLHLAIRNDPQLLHPAWNWVESAPGLRFLERFFITTGMLSLCIILMTKTPKRFLLLPVFFYALLAGSVVIIQSESVGAEVHHGRAIGSAWLSLALLCLILPLLAGVLFIAGKKRKPEKQKALIDLYKQALKDK